MRYDNLSIVLFRPVCRILMHIYVILCCLTCECVREGRGWGGGDWGGRIQHRGDGITLIQRTQVFSSE